jgi:hypothetical protein
MILSLLSLACGRIEVGCSIFTPTSYIKAFFGDGEELRKLPD